MDEARSEMALPLSFLTRCYLSVLLARLHQLMPCRFSGDSLIASHVLHLKLKPVPLLLCFALLLIPTASYAWQGKAVGVTDGVTIQALHDGKAEKIQLYGVDCPEKRQDFGTRAKQFTSGMVFGRTVEVEPVDTDRYGRTVAVVKVDSKCGI